MTMYTTDQIWDGMVDSYNIDKDTADNIEMYFDDFFCPEAGKVPQCVTDAWEWAKNNDVEVSIREWMDDMSISNMTIMNVTVGDVCKGGHCADVIETSIDFMKKWYSAATREEACK